LAIKLFHIFWYIDDYSNFNGDFEVTLPEEAKNATNTQLINDSEK